LTSKKRWSISERGTKLSMSIVWVLAISMASSSQLAAFRRGLVHVREDHRGRLEQIVDGVRAGLEPFGAGPNGRLILVGDGIKAPKRGKKMPAVKLLHQQSDANTKPEYIMGHSLQAVSVLVHAAHSFFAVPLAARIHEGLVWSNRDRRTLLDKMLALIGLLDIATPFYLERTRLRSAG
jgi:hypothetical protein